MQNSPEFRNKGDTLKKIILRAAAAILALCIIFSLGYYGKTLGLYCKGNGAEYSVKKTESKDSLLKGKTIIFLGSSVTYGAASLGESFVDFLVKQDGITAVKEAKSGTTLVDDKGDSYISRMKKLDTSLKPDLFVCQLSTNDATKDKPLGKVSDSYDREQFDTHTVAGAVEYIVSYARDTWDCPVMFYTNTQFENVKYEDMIYLLREAQAKWHFGIIDLFNDKEMFNVDEADLKLYMADAIHPTRAGYRDWWTPVIRDRIIIYLGLRPELITGKKVK